MGHDGILFCNLHIMIYNINITRNGIVNSNFTDVLQMLTVSYSLIFFNVQGGACQFLIDNDKVDHYI